MRRHPPDFITHGVGILINEYPSVLIINLISRNTLIEGGAANFNLLLN